MLSERVLDELVRRGTLSEELGKALWPDLSVESKLQLITALHAEYGSSTPYWLIDAALEDKSPAVQYFALRLAYLRTRRTDVADNMKQFYQASDEDVARHAKAHALEHPLAKAAVADFNSFSPKEQLLKATQLERLAHVRNERTMTLNTLVDFLELALDQVDDRLLAEVAQEFFMRPDTKSELQRGPLGFLDGDSAYYAGKGIKEGWALARKAGPVLANVLVSSMPTSLGLGTVEAKELATLPEHALEMLVYDTLDRKEVGELLVMIREQPQRFPEKVVKALDRANEFGRPEASEVRRERRLSSPLGERAILEVVLELQQQVTQLTEQLQDMHANPPRRGFFG